MTTNILTLPTDRHWARDVEGGAETRGRRTKRSVGSHAVDNSEAPKSASGPSAANPLQVTGGSSAHAGKNNAPTELSKSSVSWVSFQHGVNLAEAIEPGSSKRMTQDELIALPGKMSAMAVTPEQELFVASTRIGPALEWAVANGVLEEKTDFSQTDIQKALAALDQHLEKVAGAIGSLSTPMPMRKDYFTGTQLVSPIKGHDDPDNKKYPVAIYDDQKFGEDFKADLATKKTAYATIIQYTLSTLSPADQMAIAHGEVGVYAMKSPGEGGELERSTFLIKAVHKGKTTVYEVNPERGTVIKRDNYVGIFEGHSVIGKQRLPDGSYSNAFTAWPKPSIQGQRYETKVDRQAGARPDNTPFFAQLYTLEPLAIIPPPAQGSAAEPNHQAQFVERAGQIGTKVSETLFYMKDLDLLYKAEEDPERVTEAEKADRDNYQTFKEDREKRREILKGFVPFWRGIEAIVAGRPLEGIGQIWIDLLSLMLPVEQVAAGLTRGAIRLVKPIIPKFLKPSVNFASYSLKPGVAGVKWEGGVQGLTWAPNASKKAAQGIEQFKVTAGPLPRSQPGVRQIELNGVKYFVSGKPDAGDGMHYVLRVEKPDDPTKLVSSGKIAKPDDAGVWRRRGVEGGGKISQAFSQKYRDARKELAAVVEKHNHSGDALTEQQKDEFTQTLTKLIGESNADNFEHVGTYIHADSDFVNQPLRANRRTPELEEFLREFDQLKPYEGKAYRSAYVTPEGASRIKNGVGKVFKDPGVQSASATAHNSVEWEGWAKGVAKGHGDATQQVVYVFDESIPKKNLSTSFLKDHVAIGAGQPMKVMAVQEQGGKLFVYFSAPSEVPGHIYNIYDGAKIY
ncbi:hypothetical protein [Pseudomonas sp. MPB23]|uniref:hypothetical protein n=1 Tax=Pseudomonas sp. MPB23 TaxID=3388490 RepID=UPI0039852433